jgi:hypothetical protein
MTMPASTRAALEYELRDFRELDGLIDEARLAAEVSRVFIEGRYPKDEETSFLLRDIVRRVDLLKEDHTVGRRRRCLVCDPHGPDFQRGRRLERQEPAESIQRAVR